MKKKKREAEEMDPYKELTITMLDQSVCGREQEDLRRGGRPSVRRIGRDRLTEEGEKEGFLLRLV
jgi:hypothetical protein